MSDSDETCATTPQERKHDGTYKRMFQHPRLVRELAEHFIDPALVAGLDLSRIERVDAAFISPTLVVRDGDRIWKVPYEGGEALLYVMLEFQSSVDQHMVIRVLQYVALLYGSLADQSRARMRAVPDVLPIVLYNGETPWSAATSMRQLRGAHAGSALSAFQADVGYYPIDIGRLPEHDLRAFDGVLSLMFQLEQATLDQAHEVVARLDTLASAEGASQLWQDLLGFITELLKSRGMALSQAEINSFAEVRTMLGETFEQWKDRHSAAEQAKGREEGREEGRERALRERLLKSLRLKFGEDASRAALIEAASLDAVEHALDLIITSDDEAMILSGLREASAP